MSTSTSAGAGRNRRSKPRIPANLRLEYRSGARSGHCRSIDLSANGLGFDVKAPLMEGAAVELTVFYGEGHSTSYSGTVRRVKTTNEGMYRVGVEFEKKGTASLLVAYMNGDLHPEGKRPDRMTGSSGYKAIQKESWFARLDPQTVGGIVVGIGFLLIVIILLKVATT